jgi:hypothetical protein
MMTGAGQRLRLLRQDGVVYVHNEYNLFNLERIFAFSPEADLAVTAAGRGFMGATRGQFRTLMQVKVPNSKFPNAARSVLPRGEIVQFTLQPVAVQPMACNHAACNHTPAPMHLNPHHVCGNGLDLPVEA